MQERKALRLIGQGKTEYINDIARAYYDDVWRFCCFLTGDRDWAWDLAQETFLRFIRYVDQFKGGNVKGYLLTIAMNVCRDGKKEKRFEATEEIPEEAEAPAEKTLPEERLMLQKALLSLPDFQREAIVLHYYYDYKYREIGRMTGVSAATVKSRVRQGCRKLKEMLT